MQVNCLFLSRPIDVQVKVMEEQTLLFYVLYSTPRYLFIKPAAISCRCKSGLAQLRISYSLKQSNDNFNAFITLY
jgi:hypothetical protein